MVTGGAFPVTTDFSPGFFLVEGDDAAAAPAFWAFKVGF